MKNELLSVGIDIGTTTSQVVFSKITVVSTAATAIPEVKITDKTIVYKSEIYFTPLVSRYKIDLKRLKEIIAMEYAKAGVEKAVLAITLGARHKVDIRRSFPFFGKRFYLVFLLGRDLRQQHRQESTLSRILLTFLLLIAVLFVTSCILLTLYMIKSALGIDIFHNFHVGIWDWWLSLKDR